MQIKNNYQNFTAGYHILRVGLAITFLWMGVLILRAPEAWGGYLQSWAVGLLPIPIEQALMGTAALDIIIGILLLIDWYTWLAAVIGALHIVIVLTVSGIADITVRDIGLLTAALVLFIESLPVSLKSFFRNSTIDNTKAKEFY